MRVWLISPYHTGSHQAWAEGYARHSRHQVTLLTMARFSDKVVLITGALGGIGAATVQWIAKGGARLALTDINKTAFADPIVHGRAAAACRFVRITWTKMPSRLLVNQ